MRILLLSFLLVLSVSGSEFIIKDRNDTKKSSTWIVLPYVFSTDTTGLTGGVVGIFNGFFQPQLSMAVTVYGGEKIPVKEYTLQKTSVIAAKEARTKGVLFAFEGLRLPFSKRMFAGMLASYGYYPNQRLYLDGSNDSKKELSGGVLELSPVQTHGHNNWMQVDFRYVLPWGESKSEPLPIIRLNGGIATNREGYGGGIPFVTGQSIVGVELFYEHMSIDKIDEKPSISTNGFRLYLQHDNTDYPDNPLVGYSFECKFSADFGLGNSTQSWNTIETSYAHYFPLRNWSWSRFDVLALNLWSAYSPSWQRDDNKETIYDKHRPPMWEGARLGGWNRLRAYDSNRFSDKAALYGALEYRVIPRYNPMRNQRWNPFPIDWFELVFFAETGRVHKRYDFTLLHDMHYDVGFSLRALAAKVPFRFEMAYGEEGSAMWVMLKQPF